LLPNYGPLPFTLDFYTELLDLTPLLRSVPEHTTLIWAFFVLSLRYLEGDLPELPLGITEEAALIEKETLEEERDGSKEEPTKLATGRTKLQEKFHKMTEALCEVVNDYGLVTLLPLNIEDVSTVARVIAATDRANGYK
jgi:hypothetical protein